MEWLNCSLIFKCALQFPFHINLCPWPVRSGVNRVSIVQLDHGCRLHRLLAVYAGGLKKRTLFFYAQVTHQQSGASLAIL